MSCGLGRCGTSRRADVPDHEVRSDSAEGYNRGTYVRAIECYIAPLIGGIILPISTTNGQVYSRGYL